MKGGSWGGTLHSPHSRAGGKYQPNGRGRLLLQDRQPTHRGWGADMPARTQPAPPSRGEENLTAKDRAIMDACENDETCQTIRSMRGSTREKFLTCMCILVQEVVEDPAMTASKMGGRRARRVHAPPPKVRHDSTPCHGDSRGAVRMGTTGGSRRATGPNAANTPRAVFQYCSRGSYNKYRCHTRGRTRSKARRGGKYRGLPEEEETHRENDER